MNRQKTIAIPAPPKEVVRWLSTLVRQKAISSAVAPAAESSRDQSNNLRPRVAYKVKGRVSRSKLTPRAIQVLDFLQAHPKASAHDVEKFLVAKAKVPAESAPNVFRGAMARLRAIDAVEAKPLVEQKEKPRKKARG